VNDRGQIVGSSETASGQTHAFLWTETSGMLDLGTLGADASAAVDVNEKGEVVGNLSAGGQVQRGFFWSDATGMVELGALGGSRVSVSAINDKGLIVGGSSIAGDTASHATLWVPTRRPAR
jgi:probable HAF family extracellular repeat protein